MVISKLFSRTFNSILKILGRQWALNWRYDKYNQYGRDEDVYNFDDNNDDDIDIDETVQNDYTCFDDEVVQLWQKYVINEENGMQHLRQV